MNITQLLFVETGTYDVQYSRPFQIGSGGGLTRNALAQLQEKTAGGSRMSPGSLAGVASGVIRPTTEAGKIVNIANGWNERRMTFMMTIVFNDPTGLVRREHHLTGYTDHVGVSALTGTPVLDPNMRLYINNSIETRTVMANTGRGLVPQTTVVDTSQILMGEYNPRVRSMSDIQVSMRPEDLFNVLELGSGVSAFDTRAGFSSGIKKSSRANNASTSFLARSLTAIKTAAESTGALEAHGDIMSEAAGKVSERGLHEDAVLAILTDRTGLTQERSITFGELAALDSNCTRYPVLQVVKRPANPTPEQAATYSYAGENQHWQGRDVDTVIATLLTNAVPSLMVGAMMTRIAFTATNRTIDGSWEIRTGGVRGFVNGLDMSPYIQHFLTRLESEILPDVTSGGRMALFINCDFNLLYQSKITISSDGQPAVTYCAAQFADGLFAPTMGDNYTQLSTLANDIGSIADNIATVPGTDTAYSISSVHGQPAFGDVRGTGNGFPSHNFPGQNDGGV